MLYEKIINTSVKYVTKPFRITQDNYVFVVAEDIDVDELLTHANYKKKLKELPILTDSSNLIELILSSNHTPSEKARFITILGYDNATSRKLVIDYKLSGGYHG